MTLLESRKIIRVGAKSFAVSLPKKWVSALGLKPGDIVDLVLEKNGTIVIKPRRPVSIASEANCVTISARGMSKEEIIRTIEGSYIEGFDVIRIVDVSEPALLAAELAPTLSTRLPGAVVLEEEKGVVIKVALSEEVVDINEVLNKMVSILGTMYEALDAYLRTLNENFAHKVLVLDDELDRMYFLGLRILKKGITRTLVSGTVDELRASIDLTLLIKSIEHVGDALDRSVRYLMASREALQKYRDVLLNLFRMSMKLVFDALAAYRDASFRMCMKVASMRRDFRAHISEHRREARDANIINVLNELELIAAIAADIVDTAITKYASSLAKSGR